RLAQRDQKSSDVDHTVTTVSYTDVKNLMNNYSDVGGLLTPEKDQLPALLDAVAKLQNQKTPYAAGGTVTVPPIGNQTVRLNDPAAAFAVSLSRDTRLVEQRVPGRAT